MSSQLSTVGVGVSQGYSTTQWQAPDSSLGSTTLVAAPTSTLWTVKGEMVSVSPVPAQS